MNVNTCESELCLPHTGAASRTYGGAPRGILWRSAVATFRFLRDMLRGLVERRIVDALSHHSLQDIGLTRFEIDYDLSKGYRHE